MAAGWRWEAARGCCPPRRLHRPAPRGCSRTPRQAAKGPVPCCLQLLRRLPIQGQRWSATVGLLGRPQPRPCKERRPWTCVCVQKRGRERCNWMGVDRRARAKGRFRSVQKERRSTLVCSRLWQFCNWTAMALCAAARVVEQGGRAACSSIQRSAAFVALARGGGRANEHQ